MSIICNLDVIVKSEFEVELSDVAIFPEELDFERLPTVKELTIPSESSVLEETKDISKPFFQKEICSTTKTYKPVRTKKMPSNLKNYHLNISRKDCDGMKLNIQTEQELEFSALDYSETEFKDELLPKRVQSAPGSAVKSKKRILVPPELRLKNTFHLPVRCKSRRCAYCSTKKNPHRTGVMCATCNVGLCLFRNDSKCCFQLFHGKDINCK